MSGHSKWATIKRAKEATDAKRSSIFSKLSKDIILAAKLGQSGDINMNPMLRVAVSKAKGSNMPSDKIEKAINRGLGVVEPGEINYEKTYEAYSSSGVAILIDVETNNPNRTLTDVKTIINKSGGKMVPEGSLSWQFKEYGYIKAEVLLSVTNLEEDISLPIIAIDGVDDLEYIENEQNKILIEVYTLRDSLREVNQKLKETFEDKIEIDEISIIKDSQNKFELNSEEEQNKLSEVIDTLKELDEVSNVWVNL